MKPFYKLRPAYRHGTDTPWGGTALREIFGMAIPDDHTGEALAASTLPGLESTTADGRTLTEIAGRRLPLLLKFIDAREALSVQVHPDDAYAKENEGGKLGKTEAWLVLDAKPGAKLVFGLLPGTDVGKLSGAEIEARLRWLDVKAGDVLYIPAGMVHAIGGGILLYEIQQTSDVTYRFWDWGRPRELHWDKACDVARADLQYDPVEGTREHADGGSITRYLDTPYFRLDRLHVDGSMALPEREGFQFVTALCDGALSGDGERETFAAGDTFYVPEGIGGILAEAKGDLLISSEGAAR